MQAPNLGSHELKVSHTAALGRQLFGLGRSARMSRNSFGSQISVRLVAALLPVAIDRPAFRAHALPASTSCVRFPLAVAAQRLRWRKPAQAVGGSPPAAFSASSRALSNSYIPVISSSAICRPMIRYCRVRGSAGHPPVSCPQERPRPCSSRGPRNRGFSLPPFRFK
jgi:hypothetical protein